jgi:hypothetical protein
MLSKIILELDKINLDSDIGCSQKEIIALKGVKLAIENLKAVNDEVLQNKLMINRIDELVEILKYISHRSAFKG